MPRALRLGPAVVAAVAGLVIGAAAAPGPVRAQPAAGALSAGDRAWFDYASQDNVGELMLCRTALARASAAGGVKTACRRFVRDHTTAQRQVKALAARLAVDLKKSPDDASLVSRQQLERLSGTRFDLQFMVGQVLDHEHDIATFQDEARGGRDARVRALASQQIAVLREHLRIARAELQRLGGDPGKAPSP